MYAPRRAFVVATLLILVALPLAIAQEHEQVLDEQRIIPGDALYPLKIGVEGITNSLTLGADNRVERGLRLAERRLAEAKQLAEREDIDPALKNALLDETTARYDRELGLASSRASESANRELTIRVAERTQQQQDTLSRVLEQVPDQAKPAIERAREAADTRRQRAIDAGERLASGQGITSAEVRAERELPSLALEKRMALTPQDRVEFTLPLDPVERARMKAQVRDRELRGSIEQAEREEELAITRRDRSDDPAVLARIAELESAVARHAERDESSFSVKPISEAEITERLAKLAELQKQVEERERLAQEEAEPVDELDRRVSIMPIGDFS